MKKINFSVMVFVMAAFLLVSLSDAADKGKVSGKGVPSKTTTPAKTVKPTVAPAVLPKAVPIGMTLSQRGKRVFLVLSRDVIEVQVFLGDSLIQKFGKGNEFDISDAVKKAGDRDLHFVCTDASGYTERKTHSIRAYAYLFKPVEKKPEPGTNPSPALPKTPSLVPSAPAPEKAQPAMIPQKAVPPTASIAKPESADAAGVSIESIFARGDAVWVKVVKTGPGRLGSVGALTLDTDNGRKILVLSPKVLEELSRKGSSEVDTGIELKERSTVRASIAGDMKSPSKKALITPMAALRPKTMAALKPKEPLGPIAGLKSVPQKADTRKSPLVLGQKLNATNPPGFISGSKTASSLRVTEMNQGTVLLPSRKTVPKRLERGISVSWGARVPIHRSDSMNIYYTILREVSGDTPFNIYLRKNGDTSINELVMSSTAADEMGVSRELEWSIPTTIPFGAQYYFHAESGALWGQSNTFDICQRTMAAPSIEGFHVILDPNKGVYAPGETVNIRFSHDRYLACPNIETNLRVFLGLEGEGIDRIGYWAELWSRERNSGLSYSSETMEGVVPVSLPMDASFQNGRWSLKVLVTESCWGQSRSFEIGSITEGSAFTPGCGIEIVYPNGGETVAKLLPGNGQYFEWQYWGNCNPSSPSMPNWVIELHKGGRGVHTWRFSAGDVTFDEVNRLCRAPVGMPESIAYGDDYRLVVIGGDMRDESFRDFSIVSPLIVERPDPSGVIYNLNDYTIRWYSRASMTFGDLEVCLVNASQRDLMEVIATVGESTGSFRWTVPYRFNGTGFRIMIRDPSEATLYSASEEFQISYPGVSVTSPGAGEHWTGGIPTAIQWASSHFPRAVTGSSLTPTLDIFLVGSGVGGRSCIARDVPIHAGSYRWNVRWPNCLTWGDSGSMESVPLEWATGTMGGASDILPGGDYQIDLYIPSLGMHVLGNSFVIE